MGKQNSVETDAPIKVVKPRTIVLLDDAINGLKDSTLEHIDRRAGVVSTSKKPASFRRKKDKKTGKFLYLPIQPDLSLATLKRNRIKRVAASLHKDAALIASADDRVKITAQDVKKAVRLRSRTAGIQMVF